MRLGVFQPHNRRIRSLHPDDDTNAAGRAGLKDRVTSRVELDNGSAIATGVRALSSSNPSVLSVIDAGWVKGIAPGTATLTGSYDGVPGTVSLRVDP